MQSPGEGVERFLAVGKQRMSELKSSLKQIDRVAQEIRVPVCPHCHFCRSLLHTTQNFLFL